jgi:hypothetical protein
VSSRLHLYEIPITLISNPSRKFMRDVATHRRKVFRTLRCSAARALSVFKERTMLDLILISLGLGFFVLAIAYAYACDRL